MVLCCENCKHCEFQKGAFVCTLKDDRFVTNHMAIFCKDFVSLGVFKEVK